jgi:uncharacterized membrane protein (DUF373 family)
MKKNISNRFNLKILKSILNLFNFFLFIYSYIYILYICFHKFFLKKIKLITSKIFNILVFF